MKTLVILVCGALAIGLCMSTHATTWNVPSLQCPTIQAGIDSAAWYDTVSVAPGTYFGPGNRDLDFDGKPIVVMSQSGPEVTIIDCGGSAAAWHRGFWFHNGEWSEAVVKGFTITGGYHDRGGGILVAPDSTPPWMTGSSPTIIGNILTGDTATVNGGAIATLDFCSPTIEGNTIVGNMAKGVPDNTNRGGGIHVVGTYYMPPSGTSIVGNTIAGNRADYGGGISCVGFLSWATISDNTISENLADSAGAGIYCWNVLNPKIDGNTIADNDAQFWGGGIACERRSSPDILDNTITGNTAGIGGGIWCSDSCFATIGGNTISRNLANYGGGIDCMEESSPTISNNLISGNWASYGGGIYCWSYSSPTIVGNVIVSDTADYHGGGICLHDVCAPEIRNNTIAENVAYDGGGIFCEVGCFAFIDGSTITENAAVSDGGGICCRGSSSIEVVNSILWENSAWLGPEAYVDASSAITVRYCDVEDGQLGIWVQAGGWLGWGPGNINADPLFVSGQHGDYYLSHTAAGQAQQSPCVDAGDPAATVPTSTTRTDEVQDSAPIDMGRHYPRPSLISIQVTPDSPYVNQGEDLWFTVDIVNVTDSTLTFDVWVDAYLANGNPYGGNPVLGPAQLTRGAGSGFYGVRRSVHIPQSAPAGGPYELRVRAGQHGGSVWAEGSFEFYIGAQYLIWEPDPTPISGQAIKDALSANGRSSEFVVGPLGNYNLSLYGGLFVCLGMYPNNGMIMVGSAEAAQIETYIADGGDVYMEGGDVWYYDPLVGGHNFGPSFGILALADGSADLFNVSGVVNTLMPGVAGLTSAYTGENSWVDELTPISPAQVVFTNSGNPDDIGVGNATGAGGHTIGTSFELGGTAYNTFVVPAVAEFVAFFEE